jgi:hypothetical protein
MRPSHVSKAGMSPRHVAKINVRDVLVKMSVGLYLTLRNPAGETTIITPTVTTIRTGAVGSTKAKAGAGSIAQKGKDRMTRGQDRTGLARGKLEQSWPKRS